MLALFKYITESWEASRGYLREDLEHIEVALNQFVADHFNDDGSLSSDAIAGDATKATRYVSNTGPHHQPKWAQVNLANGVTGRLPFAHLQTLSPSRLLGRGSSLGVGDPEDLTIGPGLTIVGRVVDASPTALVATPDIDSLTHPFMGSL